MSLADGGRFRGAGAGVIAGAWAVAPMGHQNTALRPSKTAAERDVRYIAGRDNRDFPWLGNL